MMYHTHDTDMWNVHRMFITYIHRTQESRNTKNTYDFLVQVRNFLSPFLKKVFRHKERGTIFLCWLFHLPHRTCGTRHKATGSLRKSLFFFGPQDSTHLTEFLQNPQNPPRALPVHDIIYIHWSTSLWDFYFDICERHILPARESTSVLKAAPNKHMCWAERFSV